MTVDNPLVTKAQIALAQLGPGPENAPSSVTTTELQQFIDADTFEHYHSEALEDADINAASDVLGFSIWITRYVGLGIVIYWRAEDKLSEGIAFDIDLLDSEAPVGLKNMRGEDVELIDAEGELNRSAGEVLDDKGKSTWLELNFCSQVNWELEALKACP